MPIYLVLFHSIACSPFFLFSPFISLLHQDFSLREECNEAVVIVTEQDTIHSVPNNKIIRIARTDIPSHPIRRELTNSHHTLSQRQKNQMVSKSNYPFSFLFPPF
jgi:hypothetical protein